MTLEREDDFPAANEHEANSELDAEEIEVAEIRTEIEETRIEMGGTLNELGERLDPGHLMDRAKENVREATIGRVEETAKGISEMVMETIKRNPLPAVMAGAGLALLWMNKSKGNGNGNGHSTGTRYGGMEGTTARYGDSGQWSAGEGPASKVQGVASSVGQNVAGAAGQVGETIGEAGQNVGQALGDGAQEVSWRFERFMDSSPLAMGAIALGAGAVVGAVIPETPKERQFLGEASRAVSETVRDTVGEVTDRVEAEIGHAAGPGA